MSLLHNPCNAYCQGDVHCIETLTLPDITQGELWQEQQQMWYTRELLMIRPAPEADLTQWRALIMKNTGRALPQYTKPWLVFARLKETDDVAS